MAYKIVYTHLANLDVEKAIDYYLLIAGRKIMKSFYLELLSAENILKNTKYFEKIYKDFHRLPLKSFPYIVIYKVDEKNKAIVIYRIFHTSQNPEKYPN